MLPTGKNVAQRQGLTSNRFTFETPAAGGGGGSSLDTVLKNSIIANDRRGNVDKGEVVQCGNARARGKRFTKGTVRDPRERNLCRLTRELIFWFGRNGLTPPRGGPLPLPAVSWSPGGDACQDWPPGQNIPTKSHICPQRTYTVRDKRSMGCEPLQRCFWTCIIDKLCFNMRRREMTIKRNIRNLLFWWQKIIIIFNQNFNLWVYCRANFLLAFFLVDILTIENFLVDRLIFLEIS